MENTVEKSIPDLIREALDGRTQRWLSLKAKIFESELSKKMNGIIKFTDSELDRISNVLKVELPRS